jgi:hypothetical protein
LLPPGEALKKNKYLMKTSLTFLLLLSCMVSLRAQPAEFDPQPCTAISLGGGTFFMSIDGFVEFIGPEGPSANDWVAAIDEQGHIIGRTQLVETANGPGSCGGAPGPYFRYNLTAASEPPAMGDLNNCAPAPYGGADMETITLVAWDADGDFGFGAFYSLPATVSFVQGGVDNSSIVNCILQDFSAIYTDFENPLPIVLNYFTAVVTAKKKVDLNWATSQEVGAAYFEVERSADGDSWNAISSVAAIGDSDERQLYTIRDETPLAGTSYYRLRQVDRTGLAYSSGVQTVTLKGSTEQGFSFSPNPISGANVLTLRLDEGWNLQNATATMFDMSGRQVAAFQQLTEVNRLSLPALPAGMYSLRITDNDRSGATRLIVK